MTKLPGLYPPNDEAQARYAAWRRTRHSGARRRNVLHPLQDSRLLRAPVESRSSRSGSSASCCMLTRFAAHWAAGSLLAALPLALFGLSPLGNRADAAAGVAISAMGRLRAAHPTASSFSAAPLTPTFGRARRRRRSTRRLSASLRLPSWRGAIPKQRIIFSGGSNGLSFGEAVGSGIRSQPFQGFGVAADRVRPKSSRATRSRTRCSRKVGADRPRRALAARDLGLCTCRERSAYSARRAFAVEAYPVDWRTTGPIDVVRPFPSISEGLRRTDVAVHEWIGLLLYRLTGKTAELFPGP